MVGWIGFCSWLPRIDHLGDLKHCLALIKNKVNFKIHHNMIESCVLCHCSLYFIVVVFFGRLKNQRKAVVTTVDKKIPNGILEEQGNIVVNWT